MKFLIALFYVVALTTLANALTKTWGQRRSGDSWMYTETVQRPAVENSDWYVNVVYSEKINTRGRIITGIFIHDRLYNDTSVTPSLLYGGVNEKAVTINLKSHWNGGIDTVVDIYGKFS